MSEERKDRIVSDTEEKEVVLAIDSILGCIDELFDEASPDAVKERQLVGCRAFRLLQVKE